MSTSTFLESPLVNCVLLLGLAAVAPLALGGRRVLWWFAAGSVALGMCARPGWAVAFAIPLVLPLVSARRQTGWSRLAWLWCATACGAVAGSLAGLRLFGIGEPIARLTGVHYVFAGVGALVIAERLRRDGAWLPRLARFAVVVTAAAPPVVALGFVVRHPLPQVGGAVLMTLGVWSTAVVMGRSARDRRGAAKVAALVATLSTWVPMVLAVLWAASNYWLSVPALSVPEMGRTHGITNAVGFVLAGLVATGGTHPAVASTIRPESRPSVGVAA